MILLQDIWKRTPWKYNFAIVNNEKFAGFKFVYDVL